MPVRSGYRGDNHRVCELVTMTTLDAVRCNLNMANHGDADGGMWNLPRATISHDTKNLLQSTLTRVAYYSYYYYTVACDCSM